MIHDATVVVTCDGDSCWESETVELDYIYYDYSGKNGAYNSDDSAIEEELERRGDWIVDDGKHYCCQECKDM